MNILFLGIGVVGQRHIRNIKSRFKKVNFYTLNGKHSKQFYGVNRPLNGSVKDKYNLKQIDFGDINKNVKIDAAFICLPNHLHSKFLKKLFQKNIHIFIEKPGGINNYDLKSLRNVQKKNIKKKLKIMFGYHLRFNPLIIDLKKIIKKKKIGKILNVLSENGEHIADYRKYQKYWKVYHSKKKEGGGVLLNQIHEIDYLLFLFDKYKLNLKNSFHDKISNLKIDTEDTAFSNFVAKNKNEKFLITLLLNSYERPKYRRLKIVGTLGKIIANLSNNTLDIYRYKIYGNGLLYKNKIFKKKINYNFKRNDLFKKEVFYFLDRIKKNKQIDNSYGLTKSIEALELTLKIKKILL